jgi:hypothetical protein
MTHVVCNVAQVITLLCLVLGELVNGQICELVYMLEGELAILEQVQEA